MKMISIMCHALPRHKISTQLNIYVSFWSGVLDSTLYQNTNRGNIFWKNAVYPCSTAPETCTTHARSLEVVLVTCGGLTPY